MTTPRSISRAAALLLALAATPMAGCERKASGPSDRPGPVSRGEPEPYASVAARHNDRVERLSSFRASATIRFRYRDEDGNRRTEQGDGLLQILRPDRTALSVRKVGNTLFWLGSDAHRYWWLDLTETPTAFIGRHELFNPERADAVGLGIAPRDIVWMIGLATFDASAPGRTQWSEDGRLLGVTTLTPDGSIVRTWFDPSTNDPREVEVFDSDLAFRARALLEGSIPVDIRDGRARPRVPERVHIEHPGAGVELRLTLSGASDGPISERAFVFAELERQFRVERTVDLDARSSSREHTGAEDAAR